MSWYQDPSQARELHRRGELHMRAHVRVHSQTHLVGGQEVERSEQVSRDFEQRGQREAWTSPFAVLAFALSDDLFERLALQVLHHDTRLAVMHERAQQAHDVLALSVGGIQLLEDAHFAIELAHAALPAFKLLDRHIPLCDRIEGAPHLCRCAFPNDGLKVVAAAAGVHFARLSDRVPSRFLGGRHHAPRVRAVAAVDAHAAGEDPACCCVRAGARR